MAIEHHKQCLEDNFMKVYIFLFDVLVIRCEYLKSPINGRLNTTNVGYGVTVLAECDHGYKFTNDLIFIETTCLFGKWTNTIEDCEGK